MPTLDWIGKKAVLNHDKEVPFHLLQCDRRMSVGEPGSGNLLVEGDNLLALKSLLPYYAGGVKCIYIDPPYNTGNEGWVYNDAVNSPEIRAWLGKVVGKESEDLSRHDKWLCMMLPRLKLLRQFLREDGVIIVSIDDFEDHHLRLVMDEVFGSTNFIARLVWDKTRKNDARLFSVGHEYLLVYARSLGTLRKLKTKWRESKPGADDIFNTYNRLRTTHGDDDIAVQKDLRDWYQNLPSGHPAKKHSRYKHVDKNGVWRDRDISWPGGGGPRYEVMHPRTGKPCVIPEAGWRFATPEKMKDEIDKGLVIFREDETNPPFRKKYLFGQEEDGPQSDDGDDLGAQVMTSIIQKQAQVTTRYLRNMFDGSRVFENPKDHEVLKRLINYVTGPQDIILDSFAGSGSTGHAVLELNMEHQSDRRFILIEMDPNICRAVTRGRLSKAIDGYEYKDNRGNQVAIRGVGGGVSFCELGRPLFDENGNIREAVSFSELAAHIYFCETGEPIPKKATGKSPLLGVHQGRAIYLLYNGVLGDKSADGGNVLTRAVLESLPPHSGPKVVYGNGCRLGRERLKREQIVFRQTPYEIRVD